MKYRLTIIILFSIISLFAAEENKEKESEVVKEVISCEDRWVEELITLKNSDKYEDQLTKQLIDLFVDSKDDWYQETIDRIQELIDAGANINILDGNLLSVTLLSLACTKNNIPFIETCLTHGAPVNGFFFNLGMTPLFFAFSPKVAQLLLDAHADVNVKKTLGPDDDLPSTGPKALHYAAGSHEHSPEVVALLCDHTSAEPLSLDDLGRSPLYFLCLRAQYEKTDSFFKKARALIWWSSQQVDILDRERQQTPRDCLMRISRDLLKGFDAIVVDVKLARAQLLSHELTMSLKTFNQRPQLALKELIENQGLISSVADIIVKYAGENTPPSLYPALVDEEGGDLSHLLSTVARCTPKFLHHYGLLREEDDRKEDLGTGAVIDEKEFVVVEAIPDMFDTQPLQRKKTQKKNYFSGKRSSSKKCLIS